MLMLGQGELCKCIANDGADSAFNVSNILHFELDKLE